MEAPWAPGLHPDYSAFVIEIHVCRDRAGGLKSVARLRSDADAQVVATMASGGITEACWALFTEAVRSECLLQFLVKVSAGEATMRDALDEDFDGQVRQFAENVALHMRAELDRMVPTLVRETLTAAKCQLSPGALGDG